MEKVKQELNRVISKNKTWLEIIHHELMYGEIVLNHELKRMIPEAKLEIQKAQQCLDIIN